MRRDAERNAPEAAVESDVDTEVAGPAEPVVPIRRLVTPRKVSSRPDLGMSPGARP
ncbi:hypothetical protein Acsp02_48150 [Actinoplanes sp. NBRC 103695]|nr:hypothetical protein Acsp02_48150 [Actinoplanes sp. NBRC 103695]